ncbi:hypothetical protein BG28_11000 [Nesterenkonia sp. AN1]|nr:hypothetical protein BG28_11000 [Nesterenkonia sp. AN1]
MDVCGDLLARITGGDEQAFTVFYEKYGRFILLAILRVVPEKSAAESILEAVFTRVWRDASTFQVTEEDGLTWLQRLRNRLVRDTMPPDASTSPQAGPTSPNASCDPRPE